jgi:hypothetical protein
MGFACSGLVPEVEGRAMSMMKDEAMTDKRVKLYSCGWQALH